MVCDINGLELSKGDVVAPVSGDMKGKVCGVKTEDGEGFVCIRAAHRPYSKGVWYAAEHVQRLAIGKVRPRKATSNGEADDGDGDSKASSAKNAPGRNARTSKTNASTARKSTAKRGGRRTVTSSN